MKQIEKKKNDTGTCTSSHCVWAYSPLTFADLKQTVRGGFQVAQISRCSSGRQSTFGRNSSRGIIRLHALVVEAGEGKQGNVISFS